MAQSRSVWRQILVNFVNSFKPRQIRGNYIGVDRHGNKFFEIPADPSRGKRKRSRWFEPVVKDEFQPEMASEWESWLRGRRLEPPTQEELDKNLAIMQLKKKNAIVVEAKAGKMTPLQRGPETFPKHAEYEIIPGKKQ